MFARLTTRRLFHAKSTMAIPYYAPGTVVDLRSDTVTRPCDKMRDAMKNSVVGDDIFSDDPTNNKLQRDIADLLGKEDALLTPTGTMANMTAMMTICPKKGDSVILGNLSHIVNYERGNISGIGGVMPWVVENNSDATMDLKKMQKACDFMLNEHIVPITGISLESSHNNLSGKVLRMDYISKVKKMAKKRKAKLHLDGARSWNASLFLGLEMKDMVKDFDLVSVCLSKGLGCPIGSLLVGSAKDIAAARNYRKMLGGAMRQTGVFASCALVALMDWQEKLTQDNMNAAFLAEELASIPGCVIDPQEIETNIMWFSFDESVMKRMRCDYFGLVNRLREEEKILCIPGFANDSLRFVTHRDVSREQCEHVIKTLKRMTAA